MKKLSVAIAILAGAVIMLAGCSNDPRDINPEKGTLYEIVQESKSEYSLDVIGKAVEEYVPEGVEWIVEILKDLGIEGIDRIPEILKDSTKYGTCIMKYRSVDNSGKEAWLSGRLYYPTSAEGGVAKPAHILLACHHTVGSNEQIPSAGFSLEAAMVTNKGLVVVPDYLGYGSTTGIDHPYCIPEQTAKNVIDMLLAAEEYLQRLGLPANEIPVYCEGYSQGGHAALSVQRFVQNNPSLPRLKKTMCGGGPYSISNTFINWLDSGKCTYPYGVIATLSGLKACFPEILTYDIDDYFSKEMKEHAVLEKFRSKRYKNEEINDLVYSFAEGDEEGVADIDKILSAGSIDKSSDKFKQILHACQLCDLAEGWQIKSPVAFFHAESDEIVNYLNFELVEKNLKNSFTTFETFDYPVFEGHVLNGAIFYARIICGEYLR